MNKNICGTCAAFYCGTCAEKSNTSVDVLQKKCSVYTDFNSVTYRESKKGAKKWLK